MTLFNRRVLTGSRVSSASPDRKVHQIDVLGGTVRGLLFLRFNVSMKMVGCQPGMENCTDHLSTMYTSTTVLVMVATQPCVYIGPIIIISCMRDGCAHAALHVCVNCIYTDTSLVPGPSSVFNSYCCRRTNINILWKLLLLRSQRYRSREMLKTLRGTVVPPGSYSRDLSRPRIIACTAKWRIQRL